MAVKEGAHRRKMEKRVVGFEIISGYLGQILGFLLGGGGLYVAWDLIKSGHGGYGIGIALAAVGGLVSAFIWGNKSDNEIKETEPPPEEPMQE